MKNHLSFKPDIREPYRDSRPPDHSTIPQQQWQKPTFTQSTNQPNYRPRSYIEQSQDLQNDLQQRNRNNQWPVDTRQANQSNEQYQHHSSGIDVSRTRVRNEFLSENEILQSTILFIGKLQFLEMWLGCNVLE